MHDVTIELKKNHEHIIGAEFKEEYELEYHKRMIQKDIQTAIDEFEYGKIPAQIDDDTQKEIKDLKQLKEGSYSLDIGDFTYYIKIGVA